MACDVTTPGYSHFHEDRVNLTIHIVMVPVFVAGVVGTLWSAGLGRPTWMSAFAALPLLSLAAQGFGHARAECRPSARCSCVEINGLPS